MLAGLGLVAPTPVSEVLVTYRRCHHTILLKHECRHPSGSVKERTAAGLLRALHEERPIVPGTVVVESTSGNLGIALARRLRLLGCGFIAVVDPKTPAAARDALLAAGARLETVDTDDGYGGYLLTRLATVRELLRARPDYRWTNQYDNPANPLIHERSTGPEMLRQGGRDLDAVYAAVSTGGTVSGIARHVSRSGHPARVVAVDVFNSLAGPASGGPASGGPAPAMPANARLLPGVGASRPSSFLSAGLGVDTRRVHDADAVAMCHILREDTAIGIGGSAGCVLSACVADLAGPDAPGLAMCLAADDAAKYEDTLYDDGWLARNGLLDAVRAGVRRLRDAGLSFKASDSMRV